MKKDEKRRIEENIQRNAYPGYLQETYNAGAHKTEKDEPAAGDEGRSEENKPLDNDQRNNKPEMDC